MERSKKTDIEMFKMYIIHRGWVGRYRHINYRSIRYGNRNFEFEAEVKDASLLSFSDVMYTINNMREVNYKYKIFPEDKFIDIYNFEKAKSPDKYEYSVDELLNPPKKVKKISNAFLQRHYNNGFFIPKKLSIPIYYLSSDNLSNSSIVIGHKYNGENHIFETLNSIYVCENMVDHMYFDQIKEIDDYFKSPCKKVLDEIVTEIYEDEKKTYEKIYNEKGFQKNDSSE